MTTTFELTAQPIRRQGEILTPEALEFIERLHRALGERRTELLDARHGRRARIAGGEDPQFPHGTEHIREDRSWRVAPPGPGSERAPRRTGRAHRPPHHHQRAQLGRLGLGGGLRGFPDP